MKKLLTLNAGSSSIKFAIFNIVDGNLIEEPRIRGNLSDLDSRPTFSAAGLDNQQNLLIQPVGVEDHDTAWDFLLGWLEEALCGTELYGVGHRVVHGGADYSAPVKLNEKTVERLAALRSLAPGHQPHNLAGIAATTRSCPLTRQVACFDTAFHRTQPYVEKMFAIPREFYRDGIMRYGFHGLSYEYIASELASVLGDYPQRRVIVAHLGAGASMCAMLDGKSVATTMGFTALDGLPMATRCGSIDPGAILHMIQEKGMSADAVARCLHKESGLLGISGVSGDMRALQASEAPEAKEAIDYFVRRVVREIGSLAAVMGGVDALVFTAGVGENASYIRERVLDDSAWLGFEVDKTSNDAGDARVTLAASKPSAWVIPTNEELMIARHTFRLTTSSG